MWGSFAFGNSEPPNPDDSLAWDGQNPDESITGDAIICGEIDSASCISDETLLFDEGSLALKYLELDSKSSKESQQALSIYKKENKIKVCLNQNFNCNYPLIACSLRTLPPK